MGARRRDARCALAAAGTSPAPGEGGASLRRRANEVPGNRGPPNPHPNPGQAGETRGTPVSPGAPLPGAHTVLEEQSPRPARSCSPEAPSFLV